MTLFFFSPPPAVALCLCVCVSVFCVLYSCRLPIFFPPPPPSPSSQRPSTVVDHSCCRHSQVQSGSSTPNHNVVCLFPGSGDHMPLSMFSIAAYTFQHSLISLRNDLLDLHADAVSPCRVTLNMVEILVHATWNVILLRAHGQIQRKRRTPTPASSAVGR